MKGKRRIPGIAALLSFLTPGLGQLYNGQIVKGICFFVASFLIPILLLLAGLQFQFYGLVAILIFVVCLWLFIILEAFFTSRRKKEIVLKGYNKWYVYLLIILLILGTYMIPKGFIANISGKVLRYRAFKLPTRSMDPTLTVGDRLIADSRYYKKNELQRGDVVIVQPPQNPAKLFIKRVIVFEGEKIEIKNKQVYVNDEAIAESYKVHNDINSDVATRDNFGPALVPSDHCFVLGDNRDQSMDSRYWGSVPLLNIKGKPLYLYWAKDKKRIGTRIQ
ncbi:MAG: signal peptidase I [Candidatus Aminicenantes bacterium]|nr:signal peptidase I [Candidatus Aminicenantes bacterium]